MNSMRYDFYYDSKGFGSIYASRWEPEGAPIAIVQIVHGIAEHIDRYDDFANFLCSKGIMVVAEDHMGHGKSVCDERGYFNGGWFKAVEDTYRLMKKTRASYPNVPYILFGHSMGSFMARTILQEYPDCHLAGAVICGTGWMPEPVLATGKQACNVVCRLKGDRHHSAKLQALVFSGYNRRVDKVRTPLDWINSDPAGVDAYIDDPMCGFVVTAGLLRDMLTGIMHIQRPENLKKMCKKTPVLFIAGGEDPVGNYGQGVLKAADVFKKVGMKKVSAKIYPHSRHEILNEVNKTQVYEDVYSWVNGLLK